MTWRPVLHTLITTRRQLNSYKAAHRQLVKVRDTMSEENELLRQAVDELKDENDALRQLFGDHLDRYLREAGGAA